MKIRKFKKRLRKGRLEDKKGSLECYCNNFTTSGKELLPPEEAKTQDGLVSSLLSEKKSS